MKLGFGAPGYTVIFKAIFTKMMGFHRIEKRTTGLTAPCEMLQNSLYKHVLTWYPR